ncbi:MAG: hypothetical protein QGG53_18980 [Planctomycetota bacterium]|jgi:hypothetical protein|nr:hypothetical protein [Planctomycetota bacterium]
MIQRVLLFALASVFFLSPQLQAERTPQDTYRDTRAKLRKFWQGEEKLILGIIRGQEKHVANLNQRYRKTAPKFVKIRANIQKNLKQAQARLAESRSYLSKRRQEVPKKIEEAAQKAANTHRELIARGEDAKQQIEAAVAQAQRDIAHKLEKAKAEVEAGMSELRQRAEAARRKIESDLDRFKAKVDAAVSDLEKKNQQVTARYRVRYDLSRIETNLGGKKQTVSIGRLAKLHLGGNPKAPLIPRELIEQLRELPAVVDIEAKGIGFTVKDPKSDKPGRIPGVINYREGKFLGGGSAGGLLTALGALLHTLTIDGQLKLSPQPRFTGKVVSALTLWSGAGVGGAYVSVPFQAASK